MSVMPMSSAPARPFSTPSVNIQNADNVYIATNIIETTVCQEGAGNSFDSRDYGDTQEDSGCDHIFKTSASRWTQTGAFFCTGQTQTVRICDNYARINLFINKEAARIFAESNVGVADHCKTVNDAVLKCLARLQWNGRDFFSESMTVWKMTMKKGMKTLCKEIMQHILDISDLRKLRRIIKESFERGMKLMGLDCGSLVFIFQHETAEGAKEMLASSDNQRDFQQVLMNCLSDWVGELDVSWEVMQCSRVEGEEVRVDCSLFGEPVHLSWQSGSVASMDSRLIESTVNKLLDRRMNTIRYHMAKSQEQLAQKQTDNLREFMHSLLAQFTTQLTARQLEPVPQSPQSPTAEHLTSLVTDGGGMSVDHPVEPAQPPRVKVPEFMSPATPERGSSDRPLMDEEWEGRDRGRGRAGERQIHEQFPAPQVATAAPATVHHNVPDQSSIRQKDGAGPFTDDKQVDTGGKLYSEGDHSSPGRTIISKHSQVRGGRQIAQVAAVRHMASESVSPQLLPRMDNKVTNDMTEECIPCEFSVQSDKRDAEEETSGIESGSFAGVSEKSMDITLKKQIAEGFDSKDIARHGQDHGAVISGKEQDPHRDEGETSSSEPPKKKPELKTEQAEQLLSWVNVKSRASQCKDPEIQRMMEQVELALRDEERDSPRAKALDTVIVLDTSDSVVMEHLDEMKTVAHTFIDGIEDNVDTLNLEENIAVVQMGGRAWVRQHLTNDYNRVRDAVDAMTPDSETSPVGGKTPMFQALLVCLGAIEGKGGVVNVAGCHRVRPRVVFFTDGRPTDESSEKGPDVQSNVNEVKFSLVQLISEFASKKHKTTPLPIFWIPIGSNADRPFMESLAALSGGKVVEKQNVNEVSRYYKVQEAIGCVYKMVRKHKDMYETGQQILSIVNALAGDSDDAEKDYIIEEVRKKQKDPENETGDADDFDNVFEDIELVDAGALLPLGTRVRRGPSWKWNNQDTDGPGTVIQHRKKRDGWLHVMWDNGTNNVYRYDPSDFVDVVQTDEPRVLAESELIEIGVQVRRGDDWKSGDEDGNGVGIVIRKRSGKVKVRWENGFIGKYKYGAESKMELTVDTNSLPLEEFVGTQSFSDRADAGSELGATGGFDPAEGPPRRMWQWWDPQRKGWRTYNADIQDRLLMAYQQRHDGSCVINRGGQNRRVLFKLNQEKPVDKNAGGGIVLVQALTVSEMEYVRMLEEEEKISAHAHYS
ncbi:uncharacterized protein LOC143281972 [Babylonia areolata]|uniref:uncharacterized protein LOC143281972 n=1 Tax=Babylonia areolata TaxID=304850 RepID=UPI003FD15561